VVCEPISHEVLDGNATIVAVGASLDSADSSSSAFSEGIGDHAVASLESDLGLEGVLTNGTDHLERYVGAVEQTSVIR
tara:strand:- start:4 stop:237 length:234 start_codon:yes stop_codon:yes gene_type:complete